MNHRGSPYLKNADFLWRGNSLRRSLISIGIAHQGGNIQRMLHARFGSDAARPAELFAQL
jgi:hypothetical protein